MNINEEYNEMTRNIQNTVDNITLNNLGQQNIQH